ncbi:MAG: hypothetical protein JWO10_1216 [Microbacteriaceae bacterium]|nr:hypothetical protein [Microbacteriaceae bacterium]
MRARLLPSATTAVLLCLALAMTACTGPSGSAQPTPGVTETSFDQTARDVLGRLQGVDKVETIKLQPAKSSGTVGLEVVMSATVTEDQAVAIANATHRFAQDPVPSVDVAPAAPIQASLVIHGTDVPGADSTAPNAVQFDVYPKPWKSAASSAHAVMGIRSIAGVVSIAVDGGFPAVEVSDVSVMDAALSRVRGSELWKAGGDIRTSGGQLRITDLPGQLSRSTIGATIDQAARYPDGQFSIEAAKAGPSAAALYVDHVSLADAQAIKAALLAVTPDAGDLATYAVPFHIQATGLSGSVDVSGDIPGAKH